MKHKKTALVGGIIAAVLCGVMLVGGTFAWFTDTASTSGNVATGEVAINLNDGKRIVSENEFCEAETITKTFFIESQSTADVYYRLYFENVSGKLADIITATIKDGEEILYMGKLTELTKNDVEAVGTALKPNERKDLTVVFEYPDVISDEYRDSYVEFNLSTDAVQAKNNPNKAFE